MALTTTALRSQLYRLLDEVAQTGTPIEIIRKGKRLRIQLVEPPPTVFSFDALEGAGLRPATVGDPDTLPYVDFSDHWDPTLP